MLKYSPYTIKNKTYKNIYAINKNGLQTNTSKINGIVFRGGAHTQQVSNSPSHNCKP